MRSMADALGLSSPDSPNVNVPAPGKPVSPPKPAGSDMISDTPRDCSRAEVSSLSILPIRFASCTIPLPTKIAQALMAAASISGVLSAEKAGVSAAVIGAWYCSNNGASANAGSGERENVCKRLSAVQIRLSKLCQPTCITSCSTTKPSSRISVT